MMDDKLIRTISNEFWKVYEKSQKYCKWTPQRSCDNELGFKIGFFQGYKKARQDKCLEIELNFLNKIEKLKERNKFLESEKYGKPIFELGKKEGAKKERERLNKTLLHDNKVIVVKKNITEKHGTHDVCEICVDFTLDEVEVFLNEREIRPLGIEVRKKIKQRIIKDYTNDLLKSSERGNECLGMSVADKPVVPSVGSNTETKRLQQSDATKEAQPEKGNTRHNLNTPAKRHYCKFPLTTGECGCKPFTTEICK